MGQLDNKVAIVTGAGSGLGRATAKLFAREGAKVVLADWNLESAQRCEQEIVELGGAGTAIRVDVSVSSDVDFMMGKAVEVYGGLDILFNNAGVIAQNATIVDSTEEAFDRIIGVNLKGVFLGMKYAIPHMLERGAGSIVNTSSLAGLLGIPGLSIYDASKHAVVGLTKTAALEYASQNIRINCICPGGITTDLRANSAREGIDVSGSTPAGRSGANPRGSSAEPEEVGNLVLWLVSDAASYVTGTAIPIDGGAQAGMNRVVS